MARALPLLLAPDVVQFLRSTFENLTGSVCALAEDLRLAALEHCATQRLAALLTVPSGDEAGVALAIAGAGSDAIAGLASVPPGAGRPRDVAGWLRDLRRRADAAGPMLECLRTALQDGLGARDALCPELSVTEVCTPEELALSVASGLYRPLHLQRVCGGGGGGGGGGHALTDADAGAGAQAVNRVGALKSSVQVAALVEKWAASLEGHRGDFVAELAALDRIRLVASEDEAGAPSGAPAGDGKVVTAAKRRRMMLAPADAPEGCKRARAEAVEWLRALIERRLLRKCVRARSGVDSVVRVSRGWYSTRVRMRARRFEDYPLHEVRAAHARAARDVTRRARAGRRVQWQAGHVVA